LFVSTRMRLSSFIPIFLTKTSVSWRFIFPELVIILTGPATSVTIQKSEPRPPVNRAEWSWLTVAALGRRLWEVTGLGHILPSGHPGRIITRRKSWSSSSIHCICNLCSGSVSVCWYVRHGTVILHSYSCPSSNTKNSEKKPQKLFSRILYIFSSTSNAFFAAFCSASGFV